MAAVSMTNTKDRGYEQQTRTVWYVKQAEYQLATDTQELFSGKNSEQSVTFGIT